MKRLYLACAFLIFCVGLSAQEIWSLEKCIKHSMESSLTIKQSNINTKLSEINLRQSKSARHPNLNGNVSAFWNFGRTVDPTTNQFNTETFFSNNYGISSGVMLWNGSRINNNIKRNKIGLEAAENDVEQVKRNVALQVAVNYLNVLFAKENIQISEKQLSLNTQQLEQTNKLISAGARPESERLNLEAQIATSEQNLIDSKNSLDIAILNLKQSLLLSPDYEIDVEVPENIEITTDPDLIRFTEAFELAKKNRPDLYASELRVDAAEMDIKIAKAALYPSLSASGSLGTVYSNRGVSLTGFETEFVDQTVNISSTDPQFPIADVPVNIRSEVRTPIFEDQKYTDQLDANLSYGFGVGLSIPIYNNGSAKAGIERAELGRLNASYEKDLLLESLKITVQQSIADARVAKKRLEASTKTVAAQQLALDNTTKRLEIGAANSFEWETQKTNLENAELTALIDKYNYIFAIKTLEFYLGKPLKI